jgi:hypothetical protein
MIFAVFVCAAAVPLNGVPQQTICNRAAPQTIFHNKEECERAIPPIYKVPGAVPNMVCMQQTVQSWQLVQ